MSFPNTSDEGVQFRANIIKESDISYGSEAASLAVDRDSTRNDSFLFSNRRENTVERT